MANNLERVLPTCAFGNRKTDLGMGGRTSNLPQPCRLWSGKTWRVLLRANTHRQESNCESPALRGDSRTPCEKKRTPTKTRVSMEQRAEEKLCQCRPGIKVTVLKTLRQHPLLGGKERWEWVTGSPSSVGQFWRNPLISSSTQST